MADWVADQEKAGFIDFKRILFQAAFDGGHQIGGFFGAWLGGLALVNFGNYDWMWYADIVLALLAALANVPIREVSPRRAVAV